MSGGASARRTRGAEAFVLPMLLSLTLYGCVSFQAYSGPPRPSSEIAIVQGETKMLFARNESLYIRTINGSTSLGEWTSDAAARADLLPGEYTFGISNEMLGTSLLGLAAQLAHSPTVARLTFSVEAGYRYVIQFDPDSVGDGPYFVSRSLVGGSVLTPSQRVSCEPRKPLDYLDLVCSFAPSGGSNPGRAAGGRVGPATAVGPRSSGG